MATIFSSEQELLDSLKRGGWQIVGKNPHMRDETYVDENRNTLHRQVPTGNVVWSIVGPDGDPDEVVVGISGTGGPSSDYRYSVVEGPKKAIPNAPKEPTDWRSQGKWIDQPDGSKRWQAFNPASGTTEDVPGGPAPIPATAKSTPAPEMKQVGGVWYQRPAGSTDPNAWTEAGLPKEPTKAEAPVFKEFEGKVYQWVADASKPGGGTLKLAEGIEQGGHPPGYFIEGGYKVYKNWNEGTKKYEVDPSVQPEAWSPEAQAQAAKTASQPKEGDTRPNIAGGYKVTQTYRGGEWTTTEVGERATPRDIQTLTPSTEAPFIIQTDEQGKPVEIRNPNYQGPKAPTTRGELAQRVATLQSQAQAMRDKIAADKSIPPDQQSARFASWWDQNVAPQVGALEQQQQAIIADESQKAIEAQQKNLTAAANAIQSTAPYRVGPNYASSFEQGLNRLANTQFPGQKPQAPLDFTGSVGWKGPSIDQSAQEVLNARTAVQPGMDLQSALNRSQWVPGGGPPAAGGAPPVPATTGPTPDQLASIAAASQQTAAASANPANSPFGAIGSNPMLAALQQRNRELASQQTAAATAQAAPPFGALNAMPRAGAMPVASGSGPLPYNPSAFSGVMPLLPGFDYSQLQTQWQPTY
jgi:hypothetical protein